MSDSWQRSIKKKVVARRNHQTGRRPSGVEKEPIDKLLENYQRPEDIIGEKPKQLTKALVERAPQAELTMHLGYEKHAPAGNERSNTRNGLYGPAVKKETSGNAPAVSFPSR